MKVCVIGAGSSGVTVCKSLIEAGVDFDCFEKGSALGGNWRFGNDNGMSSAYRSLHINTSRELMSYSDFPMPDSYPDYPGHELILTYFEQYAAHFGVTPRISFNTAVTSVKPEGNGYRVQTDTGLDRFYDGVIVCNGHHWNARYPNFEGQFNGLTLHAHDYKTPDIFRDKRVLVVGFGNSATDIACEAARSTGHVTLSTRSGAYVVPKYMFGKPADHLTKPPLAYAPLWFKRAALQAGLWLSRGNQARFGVPVPDRPILREHPTVSQDLLTLAGHGMISVKPNIRRLDGDGVIFEDGSRENFDVIVWCTGYDISFPFFDPGFFQVKENRLELYGYVVAPEHPGLFFVGFIQPLGAIMPLAELQGRWVAKLLSGQCRLPAPEAMRADITRVTRHIHQQYIDRPRHTIQVDFFPYRRRLLKEMARR